MLVVAPVINVLADAMPHGALIATASYVGLPVVREDLGTLSDPIVRESVKHGP